MGSISQGKEELIRAQLCAQGLTIQRTLGMGGFGEVFHVTDNDGNAHALKLLTIPKRDNSIVAAAYSFDGSAGIKKREMSAGKYRHRNIQQYHGSGAIIVDGKEVGYTLNELIIGETLEQLLQRQQGECKKKLFDFSSVMEQIVSAVAEIHHNTVVHNDLKLDNVMLDGTIPNRVVVLDFGNSLPIEVIALVKEDETQVIPLPSERYRAPEIVTGKEISYRSDVWSLGIMMYQLITCENPKLLEKERGMSIDALVKENIPRRFRKIIATSLEKDPARRYADASVLLQELQRARSYYAKRIFLGIGLPSLTLLAGIFLFTARERYIRQLEERYTRECAYLLDTGSTLEAAQEAEQFCRRALGLNKQNIDARVSLGNSLLAQGKEEEAKHP
ncbi:MAG: protein kinase [Nanoarchaeota archaeon]